jgi:hypothetical protein
MLVAASDEHENPAEQSDLPARALSPAWVASLLSVIREVSHA